MKERIIIFDTTLRDGEQALQSSLTVKEKLKIALSLEKMGVDVIEAGFPISSPGDYESVKSISSVIKSSRVCSLSRCLDQDIDIAAEAMSTAEKFRIHLFLGTSKLHVESKLRKNFKEIMNMAVKSIKRATQYTDDIEFSCEDAGRTSMDHLCLIVEQVIKAGATTINIPDTVGYTVPQEFGNIIHLLFNKVPNIDLAVISVHCHNDLGMAVGNSISAIQSGARQIEGTINGIGERAGNTALEEVVMTIETRKDLLKVFTNVNLKEIYSTSRIVSKICRMDIASNKAIVGNNAFAHSSGIHQDGILKNRKNYEIISPESIGLKKVPFNLTSRSGRAAVKHRMNEMGYKEHEYDINKLYDAFLHLADKQGKIFDYELEKLAFCDDQYKNLDIFFLKSLHIQSDINGSYTAIIIVLCDSKEIKKSANSCYDPIDAVYQALQKIVQYTFSVKKFYLSSTGLGKALISQVDIIVDYNGRFFQGQGTSRDLLIASANAFISIFNSIWCSNQVINKLKILKK
ncbi:2-isopropylmalate synthase [Buchnera aphidicola (Eriosoma lanigerum)]|uniref:2-isopropylmalate synthase n=1 Tax=Buchnera aphidicola TaxID=9 RepID=UPI003463ACE4